MLSAPRMDPTTSPPRVRFAPSPTGKLHIGGARTALFNWAFARRTGGTFMLRIEDTDAERSTAEYERAILEGLRWLGLDWDEGPDVGGPHGPYRQSERFPIYHEIAADMVARGVAYRCFCTTQRLDELREEQQKEGRTPAYDGRCRALDPGRASARAAAGEAAVVRFRVPEGETRLHDLIRGDVRFSNAEVDDWVMVRANGAPTYNFVVVCDDVRMEITHVMRGEEHLTNTPKQVLLYGALGHEPPRFAHFPLMLGKDKKKLSKRTGDTALQDYRDKGYPPEAVVNFLCLQGWAMDGERELFSADEFVAKFDPADVGKGGAVFDPEKFLWMAGEYVRREPLERLAERCAPFVVVAGLLGAAELAERKAWFLRAVASEQERIRTYAELPGALAYLFAADDAVAYEEKAEKNARKHADGTRVLRDYLAWLTPQVEKEVDPARLREGTRAWCETRGLGLPQLFQPLRCALTGKPGGPDLFEVMALLGRAATLRRIESALSRLA